MTQTRTKMRVIMFIPNIRNGWRVVCAFLAASNIASNISGSLSKRRVSATRVGGGSHNRATQGPDKGGEGKTFYIYVQCSANQYRGYKGTKVQKK